MDAAYLRRWDKTLPRDERVRACPGGAAQPRRLRKGSTNYVFQLKDYILKLGTRNIFNYTNTGKGIIQPLLRNEIYKDDNPILAIEIQRIVKTKGITRENADTRTGRRLWAAPR